MPSRWTRREVAWGLLAAPALAGCATGTPRARTTDAPGVAPADRPPAGAPWPRIADRSATSRDGTRIHYVAGGRGRVPLVFVHGWSCNHRFFGPQFAAVAREHPFVALDLAGHGDSEPRRGTVSVEAFADDVEAVVAREVRGPFVLVVHSTGGRVACAAAPRFGERLLGIVGIDTFQNLGRPLPTPEQIESRLAAQRADFVGDTRRYVRTFFTPGADPALIAWVERQMTSVNPASAIAATEAFSRFDGARAIAGWPRPMVALNSDWVPTDYRRIREVVPKFDLLVLAGRGHFPNLDDPASFDPVLLATVRRIVDG
jgi:pimeloyl-ACP methyl ester carboxylesterase